MGHSQSWKYWTDGDVYVLYALPGVVGLVLGAISLAAGTDSGGFPGVRIQPSGFDLSGMVIIGYAAFALGAALGAIIRRPGRAFAVGVPAFAACRLVVEDWIRPHLVAPAAYASLTGVPSQAVWNGWVLNSGLPAGRPDQPGAGTGLSAAPPVGYYSCANQAESNGELARCAVQAHVHYVIQFQPDSHYWSLQGAETAIFAILAAALIGVTVTVVRRWTA